tara:strand:+ start:967 stop:1482 length:516 start_codon:yes stop_codon:yes gene_type:complete
MKKLITILLLLISTVLVAQDFYRDTVLERMMLKEVNVYRVERGLVPFTWNDDNTTAVDWGEYLATQEFGLTHSELTMVGTSEILANIPFIFNGDNLKLIQYTVNAWDNSPMHKRQMVQPESTRAFFAAIVYEGPYNSNSTQTLKRVIFVGQFQYSKEFYLTYKGKIYPFGK